MRAVVVDPSHYTPYYDYHLCDALRQAGCPAALFTSRFHYEALPFAGDQDNHYHFFQAASRLPVLRARRWPRQMLKALEYPLDLGTFAARMGRRRPDVVHFQWLLAPLIELPVIVFLRRLGCRIVYTVHNLMPHDAISPNVAAYRRVNGAVDAIIVHTQDTRRELAALLDGDDRKVSVIPLGGLLPAAEALSREEARQQLSLPQEGKLILFFGLIEPYKGLDLLLDALPEIVRAVPSTKLMIAGKPGDGFDGDRLAARNLAEHIVPRLAFVPSADVPAYFSAADVVALPYRGSTQSAVLLTAYSFGRPVVATRVGGLAETVDADGTGLLVDPGDVLGFGRAVARLLINPVEAEAMGTRARQIALGKYSWPSIARQTMAVYRGQRTS